MNIFHKIKKYILDIIFPIECIGCGQADTWLCKKCLSSISIKKNQTCPACHKKTDGSKCVKCQAQLSLDGLIVICNYEDKILQECLHSFKYNYLSSLAQPIGKILVNGIKKIDKKNPLAILLNHHETIVCPVPLHKKRLLERGFNQSEILIDEIQKKFSNPLHLDLLYRKRHTYQQARLDKHQRQINVRDAFNIINSLDLSDKNVIIVDDVATTLSTLNECAKVLKQNGCVCIWGLVIARGG